MGDLRESLLRQQLQREISLARKLEAEGRHKEASVHYLRAGAIYRRLAVNYPKEKAEAMFSTASQYENLANLMKQAPTVAEAREISEDLYEKLIESLIVTSKPDLNWSDIGGLDEAKKVIKEAIILPFIKSKPPFVKSPRTILLYGPPGTGKTLLAKAACSSLQATFFEARASSLLSKYFGESTKLVSALFQKARKLQPSLIFLDEVDSLAIARGMELSEAGRRVLSQLLQEIEGFNTQTDERVIIMGATNKPWDLDEAIISRFRRKIYVPLPDFVARLDILRIHLNGAQLERQEMLQELAKRTENWSGRDLASLCQEAIMHMVREQNPGLHDLAGIQLERYTLKTRPLNWQDFEFAFSRIRPATSPKELERYEEWRREFGG
ncbi:MAG: ATP-binding protein [Candidatus Aenigmatarchaeota archaeon]|nr:MAG: ATP-binding protein [Candidatus Aenigmarchaeota archaeon]